MENREINADRVEPSVESGETAPVCEAVAAGTEAAVVTADAPAAPDTADAVVLADESGATEPAPAAEASPAGSESPDAPFELLPAGDHLLAAVESAPDLEEARLKAVLEAVIYITDEPLTLQQIAAAVEQPTERVERVLEQLAAEYAAADRGLSVRELAGGYKMATKPEHHEALRKFVKNLKPPLKLSLAALETLAVIAYKQPITAPEIMEIRGVQGGGVLKTLLDRKLITTAGRKNVIGKPILYKTTREFLVQFGLKDLAELPSLKEFEELRRLAFSDAEPPEVPPPPPEQPAAEAAESVPENHG